MESKGCTNIQVAIRMRPLITTEEAKKLRPQWSSQSNSIYQIDDSGHRHQYGEVYSFDHIFDTEKTNSDIYNDIVKDFVMSSLSGLNSTIFAYGQTSSGKTYTMLGDKNNMGIMSLAIENIFETVANNKHRKYLLRVSYMEIYNEKINDLLDPNNKDVKIRVFLPATVGLQNIKEELVTSKEQMYECLKIGNLNRHIGATKANDRSSRSHTIFRIVIESTETDDLSSGNGCIQISNLNLVDLAGSERVAQTKATGMRLKEGGHINKSLSTLSLVIKQLSDGQEFVNFRDSKLTRLLQDSLGGNSKTLIIATITLASVEDTNSTLAFAQRAKTVKNKPRVNEILTEADVNKRNAALYAELQKKLSEQMMINQTFQKTEEEYFRKISNLQQQVKMLEEFQGTHSPVPAIPRRRHTICSSARKKAANRLPYDDFVKDGRDFANVTLFEDLLKRDHPSTPCKLDTILEEDPVAPNKDSTPENFLRIRLSTLEEEYNELASFTRNESNIFNETAKKADELEQQLKEAQKKLSDFENQHCENAFKKRELELEGKIKYLEEKLNKMTETTDAVADDIELSEIVAELIRLHQILEHPGVFNSAEIAHEDSVLQVIKKFNAKAKTSKDIIETEILKQINKFDCDEQINISDELNGFSDLLSQLSLFESDIPVEVVDSMKKETVEDCKVLIKIYESLMRKNSAIKSHAEKNKLLEEEFRSKIKENESLLQENDRLRQVVETLRADADMLNAMVNKKNKRILEIEENWTSSVQENEKVKQELVLTCAENSDLKTELSRLNEELVGSRELVEEVTRNCAILEDEKLNLQQHVANIEKDKEGLSGEADKLSAEVEELKVRIKSMKVDGDELNDILNEKNSEVLNLEKKCAELAQENEDLKQTLYNVPQHDGKLEKDVLDSRRIAEKLEGEKINLQQQIADLDKEKECLEKEMERTKRQMNELEVCVKTMKSDGDKLKDVLNERNSKMSDLEKRCAKLAQENEELAQKSSNMSQRDLEFHENLKRMKDEGEKLNNMLNEKNNRILDLEKKCGLLTQENEELKQKSSDLYSEKISTEREMDKLKKDLLNREGMIKILESEKIVLQQQIVDIRKEKECLDKKVDELMNEKFNQISDFEGKCALIMKEYEELKQHSCNAKSEVMKLQKDLLDTNEIINEVTNKCAILETEKLALQQQITKTGIEKQKLDMLTEESEKLTQANDEKDRIIRELQSNNSKLALENHNLREKFRFAELQNQHLKADVADLQKTNERTSLEIEEKTRVAELQTKIALEKFQELAEVKEQMKNQVEMLERQIQERQHAVGATEQKLSQSEHRVQKYKQLLEISRREIDDLKESVSNKDELNAQISDYKCQLAISNSKFQESAKLNQDLTQKVKALQLKTNYADNSSPADEEREFIMLNLRFVKEKFEDVLRDIVGQVITEQKALMSNRLPQDQRDDFKRVMRDLKSANTILKTQLVLLQNRKDCDSDLIKDNLLQSRRSFRDYFKLEKCFLQKQINELTSANEQYLQEITALKDMKDCAQCKLLKTELTRLRELPETQEKMLNSLKDQNKVLEKENMDKDKEVFGLQMKIYAERDRRMDAESLKLLEFYRDNTKWQQQEIYSLKEKIKHYQKEKDNKQSAEVQCNILQEESQLSMKYNLMKNVCRQRNEEIANLKMENERLKNNADITQDLKKSNEQTSAGVQCDTFTEKYNSLKKLTQMRLKQIQGLERRLASLEVQ